MRTILIITAMLLLAPTVLVGGPSDPATRFHDAFLAEVVDGKVAESARTYFELLADESVPAHLRREARFRFAICCVLLGRADEGRARLAEILGDFQASPVQKARAEEYLKSLGGVGIGSELDRRLQELTFELGRAGESEVPEAYSDIRVIGKPAVPYLKRLLGHADVRLRRHAFVLLCSLDEPGMADVWKPGISRLMYAPLTDYLNRRPDERGRIEEILTGFETARLTEVIPTFRRVKEFSDEFLIGLANREGLEEWVFDLLGWPHTDRSPLLGRWLVSGREPVAVLAAKALTRLGSQGTPPLTADVAKLYPHVVRRLSGVELRWRIWGTYTRNLRSSSMPRKVLPDRHGLLRMAADISSEDLVRTLAQLVDAGEEWQGEPWTNPLFTGLADAVADGLDAKPEGEVDLIAYAALVERWIAAYGKLDLARLASISKSPDFPDEQFLNHLRHLFSALDQEAAEDFARRIFAGAAGLDSDFAVALYWERIRNVGLVLAAAEGASAEVRSRIIGSLPFIRQRGGGAMDATLVKEQAVVLPRLLKDLDRSQKQVVFDRYWWFASELPTGDALENILAMAVAGDDPKLMTAGLLGVRADSGEKRTAFRIRIAVPALELLWKKAPAEYRRHLLEAALEFLAQHYRGFHPLGDATAAVEKLILDHARDIGASKLMAFAPHLKDEDLPLSRWIPRLPPEYWAKVAGSMIPAERCEELAHELTRDPSDVNDSLISFLQNARLAKEKRRHYLSRLVLSGDPRVASLVLANVESGTEVGADALEKLLELTLATEKPDLDLLERLGWLLVRTRPTEKLIPVAQELLASSKKAHRQMGIHLAAELGREELIPYLAKLLDSVDSSIRTGASETIDEIEALERLRDETHSR